MPVKVPDAAANVANAPSSKDAYSEMYKLTRQEQAARVIRCDRLAHDLGNLFAVISGYGELLAERASQDDDRRWAGEIVEAAGQAERLAKQLRAELP